ncbi:MAG: DUF5011 domain-containing protein [Solobacterium sp.]|nr:DUF5011 domain-containing protein [Solobacterium sp.]
MKILRILILILFLVTAGFFGVSEVRYFSDRDDQPPVMTADRDTLKLSVEADEKDYLQGITARDDKDGDVTDSLVVAGKSNFIEEGVFRVDYAAFDSHNNVGTCSRTVRYTDYTSPKFVSSEPFMFKKSSSYNFDFIRAIDVIDGEISNKVKVMYSTLYSATTDSLITLEVTNSLGDIEKLELNVRILTPQEYNLYLPALWQYIVYTKVGEEIEPWNYVGGVWQSGHYYSFDETEFDYSLVSFNPNVVDYNTPGVYEMQFLMESPSRWLPTGPSILYVVVRDE